LRFNTRCETDRFQELFPPTNLAKDRHARLFYEETRRDERVPVGGYIESNEAWEAMPKTRRRHVDCGRIRTSAAP
jgi:hypothetical protein